VLDKEGIALIEDVRKALIEYGQKTPSASVKKKTRKITSQLIWSPEEYIDEIDNIKRTSKTDQEAIERIRSLVRTAEEDALRSMTVTPDDTGHHMVQSRTGGDALTDVEFSRTNPIISRLEDKHQMTFGNTTGPGGNLPPEMSLSNYAHKSDDRATGLERESGIGKNLDKKTTAHARGTAYYANMKGVDMTDDAAIEAALDSKVTEQVNQARIAAQTDAPRQQFLREATGIPELYRGSVPKGLVLDPNIVRQSYSKLKGARGVIRFAPGVGAAIGLNAVSERAQAGDFEGAAGEGVAAVVGEVPVAGDILVTEAEGRAAGTGSAVPQGMTGQEYTRQQVEEAKTSKNFQQKLANEAQWAANNPGEALTNVAEAGVSTLAAAGQAALDNPMLQSYTTPLKALNGVIQLFNR